MTRNIIVSTVCQFWQSDIKTIWQPTEDCVYTLHSLPVMIKNTEMSDTFDLLLTRDLTRAHILDFNPYSPRTDPLLFTYDDLFNLLSSRNVRDNEQPELRVVDSRTHPVAISNAPAHQHNMVPFEALSMSSGRDIEEFANLWRENIRESMEH